MFCVVASCERSGPARLLPRTALRTPTSSLQSFAPGECLCLISVCFRLRSVARTLRHQHSWGLPLNVKLDITKHVWYDLGNYFIWSENTRFISIQINGNCFYTLCHFSVGRFHRNALLSDCRETCSPLPLPLCAAIFIVQQAFTNARNCFWALCSVLPSVHSHCSQQAWSAGQQQQHHRVACSGCGTSSPVPDLPSQDLRLTRSQGISVSMKGWDAAWAAWKVEKYQSTPCFWNPSAI